MAASGESRVKEEPKDEAGNSRPVGCLRILNQVDFEQADYPVYEGKSTIGRDTRCDLSIDSRSLSRVHAVLLVEEGGHFVMDRGSVNKTYRKSVVLRPKTFYELTNGVLLKFADVQCQYFTELPADFDLKEEELEERPSCEPPLDIAVKEEEPEVQPNYLPHLDVTLEEEETQERPDLVAPANLEEGEEREAGPDYEPTQAYALGEGDEDDETDDETDDDAMTARTSLTVKDASSSVFGSDDTGATTSYTTAQEKDEVEVAGMDCEPTIAYSMVEREEIHNLDA